MERGSAAASPARSTGGMCDRFFTCLTNGLSMNRHKSITEAPRNGGGGGGNHQLEEEEDEFAIRIERAEFEFGDHGDGGHGGVTTVLEDARTAAATASDEQQQKRAAAAIASDEQQQKRAAADAVADRPAAAAAVEETKIMKAATIKEDRPEDAAASGENKGAPALERKKSLLKKRRASTSTAGGGEEQGGRAPRRSGLRPRVPAVLRVPSNINEKASTFIEERRKSLGGKAADK